MLIPFSGLNNVPLCYEFVERHNGGQNFIVMMLLGKNLANLKYFKESKVFLQRAQYVASHLTTEPKEDLVRTIASDI
jgi:hypothetical protein